jgi:hypothetical protein
MKDLNMKNILTFLAMVDSDEYVLEAEPDLSSDEYVFLYPFFACLLA